MCLAIPAQITHLLQDHQVKINIGGVCRTVSIALVPEAKIGDYVIIHAGYALTKLDETEAQKTLKLFEAMVMEEQ